DDPAGVRVDGPRRVATAGLGAGLVEQLAEQLGNRQLADQPDRRVAVADEHPVVGPEQVADRDADRLLAGGRGPQRQLQSSELDVEHTGGDQLLVIAAKVEAADRRGVGQRPLRVEQGLDPFRFPGSRLHSRARWRPRTSGRTRRDAPRLVSTLRPDRQGKPAPRNGCMMAAAPGLGVHGRSRGALTSRAKTTTSPRPMVLAVPSLLAAMTIAGAFWVGVLAARRLRDWGDNSRALERGDAPLALAAA